MAGRRRTPPPRAHWFVLLMTLLLLTVGLGVDTVLLRRVGPSGLEQEPPAGAAVPPEARSGGPVIDARGNLSSSRIPDKTMVLTFDDGPDPAWTPQLLDVLRRHQVPATFFVTGVNAASHPLLLHRTTAEGHEVGNHTVTHVNLGTASDAKARWEIQQTDLVIGGATGRRTALLRPPYSASAGGLDERGWAGVQRAAANGYLVVLADLDTTDWQRPGVDAIVAKATPPDQHGAIVLMHDGGGDRSQTIAAVDRLIPKLKAEGWRFQTVSGALNASDTAAPAGAGQRAVGLASIATAQFAHALGIALLWMLGIVTALILLRVTLVLIFAVRHGRRGRRYPDLRPPPVTVVVPAYNEEAGIAGTVRSLLASSHPVHVIVVDDGSTDRTAAVVEALGLPNVGLIRQPNAGKAAALTNGITAARTDLVVLVDGDTVFEPATVAELIRPFADPDVGAVAGNAKVGNRSTLLGQWQHIEYVMGSNLDRRMFDALGCMPTVPGAVGAFRRNAILEIGGVPGETMAEDTDLTMELLRGGWRVVYAEKARAWTEAPASLGQLWKQRYRWCYGTLQAMYWHRRSVIERGGAGRLGRRALPYLLLFQVLLPLLAPVVDIAAIYVLMFNPVRAAYMWGGLLLLQGVTAVIALRLDREPLRVLWSLPLQQVVYRLLMYLVLVQSMVTAAAGARLPWHKLRRSGHAAADAPVGLTPPR
jgi:cellulose synthase/poly-beta-1,6-N-acetylglucosamine synthase-like glycosyltransferase/peptidoglycan/xylan/chitin deacetylase (PgdA/CDA1 family)